MLFKREGSPFWYVQYTGTSGERVKRSTGTADRKEAKDLEGKWRLETRQQRLWGTPPSYTFDDLMLRYLKETQETKRSAERDVTSAKHLYRFFTGRVLLRLTRADVRAYISMRKGEGVKGATVNREVGLLSSALNRARHDWDWGNLNPAEAMRESEGDGRRTFLTRAQYAVVVAAAVQQKRAPYLADLVTVAVMTGCRRGELLGLEWSRVDLKANVLHLGSEHTKAGKVRLVPLNSDAREALINRFRFRASRCPDSPWVFCGNDGKRLGGVKSSFRRACDTAGLVGFRFHDLRHTCGSWLAQAGVPAAHIAAVLGHSTVRMTERYAHLAPENARSAVVLLQGIPNRIPSGVSEEGDVQVTA